MKHQIILFLLLLFVMVGCSSEKRETVQEVKETVLETSKDNVVGITSMGDTITIEDIENTIDSLNYILYDDKISHYNTQNIVNCVVLTQTKVNNVIFTQ